MWRLLQIKVLCVVVSWALWNETPGCWMLVSSVTRFMPSHWLSLACSAPQLVSLQEAKLLLKEDDELIKEVFDYWSRKRKTCKGGSLIPNVKQEKRDGSSTSDPYVAFRRRTEKMQTRKVGTFGQENEEDQLIHIVHIGILALSSKNPKGAS